MAPRAKDSTDPTAASVASAVAKLRKEHPNLEIREEFKTKPVFYVLAWILGSIVAAALPIGFKFIQSVDAKANGVIKNMPSFDAFLGDGELLLIGVVLAIAGTAEVVLLFRKISPGHAIAIGFLMLGILLLVSGASFWYADISRSQRESNEAAEQLVAHGSLAFFAVVAGFTSYFVWLAARVD